MAVAQLTWRESLRDIEACLRAHSTKLYHLGIRGNVARNTLANANATRDWRIYCDFAQRLIGIARRLYAEEPLGIELKDTVYALDSTTIDLCLSVFSWAPLRSTKAAAPHQVQRPRNRQAARIPHEQLCIAGTHDRPAVPAALASGTVFQMDQAASTNQGVLRHDRERSEVANLDRDLGLYPHRHRQEAAELFREPL